jgi:hypothetical protein
MHPGGQAKLKQKDDEKPHGLIVQKAPFSF